VFSIPFLRRRGRSCHSSEDRLARLRRVLAQYNSTHGASDWSDLDVEAALEGIEASWPPELHRMAGLQPLGFPLRSAARIAVLKPGFEIPAGAREFSAADTAGIRSYTPDAVVAPLNTALLLADQRLLGKFGLPSLRTAIAVVTRINDAPLASHHRDLLWRAFGVPIFEILLGWDGSVIARECELHDGLHIECDVVLPIIRGEELLLTHLNETEQPIVLGRTGYSGAVFTSRCECGSEAARLLNLMPVRVVVRAKSATA